jgi:hypothetical protein
MADPRGLEVIGLVFAAATFAVMSMTVFVVQGHASGRNSIDVASPVAQ